MLNMIKFEILRKRERFIFEVTFQSQIIFGNKWKWKLCEYYNVETMLFSTKSELGRNIEEVHESDESDAAYKDRFKYSKVF